MNAQQAGVESALAGGVGGLRDMASALPRSAATNQQRT